MILALLLVPTSTHYSVKFLFISNKPSIVFVIVYISLLLFFTLVCFFCFTFLFIFFSFLLSFILLYCYPPRIAPLIVGNIIVNNCLSE